MKIDHEFKNLIPPLDAESGQLLKESLIKEGCRDALIVWAGHGILLDGHNRYSICQAHGILFETREIELEDRAAVRVWIIRNQLARRNLNAYQRAALALQVKPAIAEQVHGNRGVRYDIHMNPNESHNPLGTNEQLSKIADVSQDAIYRVGVIEDHAPDEVKDQLKAGEISINRAYEEIQEKRRDEQKVAAFKELDYYTVDDWLKMNDQEREAALVPVDTGKGFNRQTNDSIEWARHSWNPVTGCEYDCSYCYARDIAARFFPQKFKPSFLPGRLLAPQNAKQSVFSDDIGYKNVFLCSMADLFGKWIPNEWINAILDQCEIASQWNFIVLTKNPRRLADFDFPGNVWVGTTVDTQARVAAAEKAFENVHAVVKFVSCEPMMERLTFNRLDLFHWVIIGGASSSTQTPEFHPPREWVNHLEAQAAEAGCMIYEKTNLLDRIREYPGQTD